VRLISFQFEFISTSSFDLECSCLHGLYIIESRHVGGLSPITTDIQNPVTMDIESPITIDTEDQSHLAQLTAVRQMTDTFLSRPTSRIPLNLPKWMALGPADTINNASNDINRVRDVLQYFSNLVTENSLQDTVAAQKLTDAITYMGTIKPKTNITKIPGSRRASYAEARQPLI
jgi:hypothetical protein